MNAIELSIFTSRINAVCDEMGTVLQKAAFSPNIRDRLDFSCAIFDAKGELCAQAAHIPVHLGSMAYAMQGIVTNIEWQEGDMIIVNDPYLGGTHLPDITLIAPVYHDDILQAFVVNRAHHADIGGETPGSMPISGSLDEEGIIIPPSHLLREGQVDEACLSNIVGQTRSELQGRGDFAAQISANRTGLTRLSLLISQMGSSNFQQALHELNAYGERLAQAALAVIPDGEYSFSDYMDDDGLGNQDIKICAKLKVESHQVHVDFSGTAPQTAGNINCPLSVAAAAVYYVFRCLMPAQTPACAGSFRPITLSAPEACLLNAKRPAAVAAGNVETSTRIVDVVMGALAKALPDQIPAASHGSMNNLAMGGVVNGKSWDYYETMGGGMGASSNQPGLSGVQTHMTNTRNTPIEVLESRYPVRLHIYSIRKGSGGQGTQPGGDGLVREFEFLADTTVTLLTERRTHQPWGLAGGKPAQPGENSLNQQVLGSKFTAQVKANDRLRLSSAGGGAWGDS
ncbi:MAG: hydantoinase B/oxoprolinase family protein [Gammaproteobacteria bacterium]|nr:hydantoinase B/oxoprolinase family protein [Gammaproteobacteria bacterium]